MGKSIEKFLKGKSKRKFSLDHNDRLVAKMSVTYPFRVPLSVVFVIGVVVVPFYGWGPLAVSISLALPMCLLQSLCLDETNFFEQYFFEFQDPQETTFSKHFKKIWRLRDFEGSSGKGLL